MWCGCTVFILIFVNNISLLLQHVLNSRSEVEENTHTHFTLNYSNEVLNFQLQHQHRTTALKSGNSYFLLPVCVVCVVVVMQDCVSVSVCVCVVSGV